MPQLSNGIVPWLSQYGTLFHGIMQRDLYCSRSQNLRNRYIQNLINVEALNYTEGSLEELKAVDYRRFFSIQSTAFFMYMMRKSLIETWQWPSIISYTDDELSWKTGNSRCAANGITKKEPWKHQTFLYFQPHGVNRHPLDYHNRTVVSSDQQLHELLNLKYQFEFHQPMECSLSIQMVDGGINLLYLHNDTQHTIDLQREIEIEIWNAFLEWQRTYSHKPKICVVTQKPDLISDHHGVWDIEIKTPESDSESLHLLANREHNNNSSTASHTLWYRGNSHIDLSDLLFWLDMKHSVYQDINSEFLLYRKDQQFVTRDIAVSSLF
jgi:hypothetical protein